MPRDRRIFLAARRATAPVPAPQHDHTQYRNDRHNDQNKSVDFFHYPPSLPPGFRPLPATI